MLVTHHWGCTIVDGHMKERYLSHMKLKGFLSRRLAKLTSCRLPTVRSSVEKDVLKPANTGTIAVMCSSVKRLYHRLIGANALWLHSFPTLMKMLAVFNHAIAPTLAH